MKFSYRIFDVEIERQVDPSRLSWPELDEVEDNGFFAFLVGNLLYCDLRNLSWAVARRVAEIEEQCIKRMEESPDQDETASFIIEDAAAVHLELELEDLLDEIGAIAGLDVGVASTVAALSAAGYIPFTSCSAGAFGGWHHEAYPLVVFCARPEAVPLLMECAEKAGAGLENESGAYNPLTVYANDIRKMRDFANALSNSSADFPTPTPERH